MKKWVQDYFDAISLEAVKRKYYSQEAVDALLSDIRARALAMEEEGQELQKRANELVAQKDDIADAIVSAKTVAQKIIADAQARGREIVGEAEEQKRQLSLRLAETERRFTSRLAHCVSEMSDELFERGLPTIERPAQPAPVIEPCVETAEPQEAPAPAIEPHVETAEPQEAPAPAIEPRVETAEPQEAPTPAIEPENLPDDLYRRLEEIADSLLEIEDRT